MSTPRLTASGAQSEGTGEVPAAVRLVERLVEAMNARDPGMLGELFAWDFVDHDPVPGQPAGVEGLRLGLVTLAGEGGDVSFHLEDCFAVGDRVAYRIYGTWTVPPEFAFQEALGPRATVSLSGVGIYRCRGDQFVDRWGSWSLRADGQALGVRTLREGEP